MRCLSFLKCYPKLIGIGLKFLTLTSNDMLEVGQLMELTSIDLQGTSINSSDTCNALSYIKGWYL